jgi:hypothetical protein
MREQLEQNLAQPGCGVCHWHQIIAQQSQWSRFQQLTAAQDGNPLALAHNHCQDVAASG